MKKTIKKCMALFCSVLIVVSSSMTNVFAEGTTEELQPVETTNETAEKVNETTNVETQTLPENTEETQPTETVVEQPSENTTSENTPSENIEQPIEVENKEETSEESTKSAEVNKEEVSTNVAPAALQATPVTTTGSTGFRSSGITAPVATASAPAGYTTLTMKINDNTAEATKSYQSENDVIGMPDGWGDSNWHIRTYRKIFLGWTPVENYTGAPEETIYSYGETVKTLVENGDANKPLYPVYASMFDALALESELTGMIEINKSMTAEETLPNSEVKESVGFESGTPAKTATVYFNPSTNAYEVSLDTHFRFSNNKVAAIVAANPVGLLKTAEGITDFGGQNPTAYSYVDLHVKLDPRVDVATAFNNVTFTSGLFMARAVLDENYNVVKTIDTLPLSGEKSATFSFDNPNKFKTFIIRTTLRNYGQDGGSNQAYRTNNLSSDFIFGDMILSSGDKTNVTINKPVAEAIKDTGDELVFDGHIDGKAAINTAILPFPLNLFAPRSMSIDRVDSSNTVNIKFVTDNRVKPVTPEVKPTTPTTPTVTKVEPKLTCADEGKVWNESKQACVIEGALKVHVVPNTATNISSLSYYVISLISVLGIAVLKIKK